MKSRNAFGQLAFTLGALVPVAIVARAEVFMNDEQAAHLIFPTLKMDRREIQLTEAQAKKIKADSGVDVHSRKLVAFVSPAKDIVFIDKVIGKHEMITIAVGVAADSSVRGVEILEYRETYGYQVRNAEWRKQFTGKTAKADLKLGNDIKNISGATLSSAHVTAGVKRLLHTYEAVKSSL